MKYIIPLYRESSNRHTWYLSEYVEINIPQPINYNQMCSIVRLLHVNANIFRKTINLSLSNDLFDHENLRIFIGEFDPQLSTNEILCPLYKSNNHGSIKVKELSIITGNNARMSSIINVIRINHKIKSFDNMLEYDNENSHITIE